MAMLAAGLVTCYRCPNPLDTLSPQTQRDVTVLATSPTPTLTPHSQSPAHLQPPASVPLLPAQQHPPH